MSDEITYRSQGEFTQYLEDGWTREVMGEFVLFWKANETAGDSVNGFEFDCVRFVSGWNDEAADAQFETVVHGIAYFDGLRHLYFGHAGDECGYLNYPDAQSLVELVTRLHQLEGECCWDAPQNREKR